MTVQIYLYVHLQKIMESLTIEKPDTSGEVHDMVIEVQTPKENKCKLSKADTYKLRELIL